LQTCSISKFYKSTRSVMSVRNICNVSRFLYRTAVLG